MERIFENTLVRDTQLNNRTYTIIIKDDYFGGSSVEEIRRRFKFIIENCKIEKPQIHIRIHSKLISDNSTIVVFEVLLLQLILSIESSILIEFRKMNKLNISLNFLKSSILAHQIQEKDYAIVIKLNQDTFVGDFKKRTLIDGNYYRSFYPKGQLDNRSSSKVKSNIKSFLLSLLNDKKVIKQISEVACELVGNVYDHANSDCILEVSVNEVVNNTTNRQYKAINMTVLNFSKTILISHIEDYFKSDKFTNKLVDESIKKAFDYHNKYFDSKYTKEHFYMISLFQKNFTTRINDYLTGGTGLTRLIESLTGRAYHKYSYVMTGNKIIFFTDKLRVSEGGFIGFNNNNNYFDEIPDPEIVDYSQFFLEGTLFNLSFIIEEEGLEK